MFTTQPVVMQMARGFARHAAAQQNLVARNLANADTPGYRAQRLPSFAEEVSGAESRMKSTRISHLTPSDHFVFRVSEEKGGANPNQNSVSLEAEMMQSAWVRQNHDMALTVQSSLGSMLRTVLGRRAG